MKTMFTILGILLAVIVGGGTIFLVYAHYVGQGRTLSPELPEGSITIQASGYEFRVRTEGDPGNTPVILLHGFPESSVMWTRLMVDLAYQGYFCIAPDQRGYSPRTRSKDASEYALEFLRDDVVAIADALNVDRFHLIGHDWGAAVGWAVAAAYADRLYSYTALSLPHVDAFSRAYREDKEQYKASVYMRQFQTPILPEFLLTMNDYANLKGIWAAHDQQEIDAYLTLFRQKYALTGALNWYRGNLKDIAKGFSIGKVSVPTLFLWGTRDDVLKRSGVEFTKQYVTGPYTFVEIDAGHWLVQEAYDTILAEILKHIR